MSTEGTQLPNEPVSVYTVTLAMVEQMALLAWQKLGLQPDMMTGKIHQDLGEAKVAIDITTQLVSFVEPELDEADKRQVQNLVRDLRMNYVQKIQEKQS